MKKGTCKHFNGTHRNKECEAGVNYDSVTPDPKTPGCGLRLPCHSICTWEHPSQIAEHAKRGSCEKYEEPTEQDIADYGAMMKQAMNRQMRVMPFIANLRKTHRKTGYRGVERCPECQGQLHVEVSSYNGHTRGQCETTDCLNWIE